MKGFLGGLAGLGFLSIALGSVPFAGFLALLLFVYLLFAGSEWVSQHSWAMVAFWALSGLATWVYFGVTVARRSWELAVGWVFLVMVLFLPTVMIGSMACEAGSTGLAALVSSQNPIATIIAMFTSNTSPFDICSWVNDS